MDHSKTEIAKAFEILASRIDTSEMGDLALDEESKMKQTIQWLHKQICPRKKTIDSMLSSHITEVLVVLVDAIVSAKTNTPWVGATISKHLLKYGIEKFCSDPEEFEKAMKS